MQLCTPLTSTSQLFNVLVAHMLFIASGSQNDHTASLVRTGRLSDDMLAVQSRRSKTTG